MPSLSKLSILQNALSSTGIYISAGLFDDEPDRDFEYMMVPMEIDLDKEWRGPDFLEEQREVIERQIAERKRRDLINIQLREIKKNPKYYYDIINPTEEMQVLAVSLCPGMIKHMSKPSEAVQLAAIHTDSNVIRDIEAPPESVLLELMRIAPEYFHDCIYKKFNIAKKVLVAAISNYSSNLYKLPHITGLILSKDELRELQEIALKQNGTALGAIKNPDEALQILAVQTTPEVVRSIHMPSDKVKMEALKKGWKLIRGMNVSEEVRAFAIHQNPEAIDLIVEPSKKLKMLAEKLKKAQEQLLRPRNV